MAEPAGPHLLLQNHHTGERLLIERVRRGDETWFSLTGSLPPHRDGPPLHVHVLEDEEGRVTAGTLSAVIGGRHHRADPGESVTIPRGAPHRWWNAGDETLTFEGFAGPAADLDRYLQAVFEVVNAGPAGRPSLFYLAHVALRHRETQVMLVLPAPLQAVLFRLVVAVGALLGRYRGTEWPGSPARCTGVPRAEGATSR